MNTTSRGNSRVAVSLIVIILIILGIMWYGRQPSTSSDLTASSTPSIPASQTTNVSGGISLYQNSELGFSVKYPSAWEADQNDNGVMFMSPIDQSQVSTMAKLQSEVIVSPGKCVFPPVTTVKERATIKVGTSSLNMISMSNNVQGRAYFNRMYSLQSDAVCYLFSFSSITVSPSSKGLTGSNLTQAENNNKAILNTADAAFTTMVKSFAFVVGPQGQDETKAAPAR